MDESDLRVLLSRQTQMKVALLDALDLSLENPESRLESLLADGAESIIFDSLTEDHLRAAGRLIWRSALKKTLFAAGSSGLEYALVAHWRESGLLPDPPRLQSEAVDRIAVVSGSCSPVTERQIARAVRSGFAEIPVDTEKLADSSRRLAEQARAARAAVEKLIEGRSVILHTSRGPDDPRIPAVRARLGAESTAVLGTALGEMLREIMTRENLKRAAATGGDISYFVARALGIKALEVAAPCAPGSPLCRVHSVYELDGREIVFKGGQVGRDDFFESVLQGDKG
jgi:uncharacterized protein YgbK (DUF1537 family)